MRVPLPHAPLGLSAVLAIVDALHNPTEGVGYINDD